MMSRVSGEPEKGRFWLSRRALVRAAGWLLAAPVPFLVASTLGRHARLGRERRDISVSPPEGDGVVFADEVIVCRSAGALRVFSSRCPHLGCRIGAASDGLLTCPCHGSRFRADGTVAAGPASRALDELAFSLDPRTGRLTVHVG
jgi:nitrite reductase/ring-hydroxylating ferredoxin subunit